MGMRRKHSEAFKAELYRQIAPLKVELDWLKKISINYQYKLLDLSRASYYYKERLVDLFNFKIMKEIDKIYTELPFYGLPRITGGFQTMVLLLIINKLKGLCA